MEMCGRYFSKAGYLEAQCGGEAHCSLTFLEESRASDDWVGNTGVSDECLAIIIRLPDFYSEY